MTGDLFPPDVEIRVFDAENNVLVAIKAAIKEDDPHEVVWATTEIEREGVYDHAELAINGVSRPISLTLSSPLHKGGLLTPWCPLRFEEPLV